MENKKVKNILFTCAGGSAPIYFAKKMKRTYNIFLADASDHSIVPHLGFPFQKIPFGTSPQYLKAIDALVKKWKIDCIIPGADEELPAVKQYSVTNKAVIAVVPSYAFIESCLDKKRLMQELDRLHISRLLPFNKKKDVRYPAVAKPIFGRGSRGVHIIKNSKELDGYLKLYNVKFNDILVQPYIGGDEYTISVVANNLNRLVGVVPKRVIIKKGITRVAVVESNDVIREVCEKVTALMQPAGPCNVQLKLYKGRAFIFEINPRLSTTAVLTDRAFGNEIALYLKHFDCNRITARPKIKENMCLFRHEENTFKVI